MNIIIYEYDERNQQIIYDSPVVFDGTIYTVKKKQSFTKRRTIGGRRKEKYSNLYTEIHINVAFMDIDMYGDLEVLFYKGNKFYIQTEIGTDYLANFSGDTLSLTSAFFDGDKGKEYKKGTIVMED
jgi:hypothetical protein